MQNVKNFVTLVLSRFRASLLTGKHLIIWEGTKFETEQKYLKFLLAIMTLESSAYNTGSDKEFSLRGRPSIHIMNNRGPRIDPQGNSMFQCTPGTEQIFSSPLYGNIWCRHTLLNFMVTPCIKQCWNLFITNWCTQC